MHRRVMTPVSAFILAYGAVGAIAQERMTPQQDQQQILPNPAAWDEESTTGQAGTMHQGTAGTGATGGETTQGGMMQGGMMGRGMMGMEAGRSPVMLGVFFALVDADSDGTISLQEFQAAHERIFKAMDANKDGKLTQDEILAFMHGVRRSAPQQ